MFDLKTGFGNYLECFIAMNRYTADGSLALSIWSCEDGPVATITKCLCDPELASNEAYVDENNYPWVVGFIEENGLGTLTGEAKASEFCVYPKVRFDIDALIERGREV